MHDETQRCGPTPKEADAETRRGKTAEGTKTPNIKSVGFHSPEAVLEVALVAAAVREAGAGRLGSADAAAVTAAIQFWLVEAKHLQQEDTQTHTQYRLYQARP